MTTSPVQLVEPVRHRDARGWFTEFYNLPVFAQRGITTRFVQDNHSFSQPRYTLRGLHFQSPPHAQEKLVRCIRGSIFDVVVDIRRGSPTFGNWVGLTLSADNGRQLFIPTGFAHGFLTLEEDCEVTYKASETYAPGSDAGLRWNDPTIGIEWPMPADAQPELSRKDLSLPFLADYESPFPYDDRPLAPIV